VSFWKHLKQIGKSILKDVIHVDQFSAMDKNDFAVDVRDIKMHYLYTQVKEDPTPANMEALQQELTYRTEIEKIF
jgi:hypothetical protein